MSQIQILKAVRTNYSSLIQIWERSVRSTHHFLSEADIKHYRELILDKYFNQVHLYFTLQDSRITGFIGVERHHVQMLFVDDGCRSQGIGKKLMLFAITELDIKSVTVNEQNTQALGFYNHLGFETAERFDQDGAGKPYPILDMFYKLDKRLTEKQQFPKFVIQSLNSFFNQLVIRLSNY